MSKTTVQRVYNYFFGRKIAGAGRARENAIFSSRKVLFASACSLMFHFGGTALVNWIVGPPKITPEITLVQEKEPQLSREELLVKFRAQKKFFIQKVLSDFHRKNTADLSMFLLKSAILDRNIKSLESGSEEIIDEQTVIDHYQSIVKKARGWSDKFGLVSNKLRSLHHFAHYNHFRDYLKGNGQVLDVLEENKFNCLSSTAFLTALESDIVKAKNYGVVLLDPPKVTKKGVKSGHVLSWFSNQRGLWQIENTDGSPPRIVPFRKGLRVPREIFMAAYLIRNGISVNKLPIWLSKYYKKGVWPNGYPVAGVSTDLPDPPDEVIPNKYFREKKPKLVLKTGPVLEKTRRHYSDLKKTGDIIKAARVDVMMRELFIFREENMNPRISSLFIIKIPEGINWCDISKMENYWSELRYNKRIYDSVHFLRYMTAAKAADVLFAAGNNQYKECDSESRHKKCRQQFKLFDFKTGDFEQLNSSLESCQISYKDSAEILKKMYREVAESNPIRPRIFYWIISQATAKDFDFVLNEFNNSKDGFIRAMAAYVLSNIAGGRAEEVKKIIEESMKKEKEADSLKTIAIARMGYGKDTLKILKKHKFIQEARRRISEDIIKLLPSQKPSEEDINELRNMIAKEDDPVVQANLIAVLAINGKINEALRIIKDKVMPEFKMKTLTQHDAEEVALAIGRIESQEIKAILMQIFKVRPQLAPEIADVFVKQGFREEEINTALRGIVSDPSVFADKRKYAAVFLIEMGGL